MCFGEIKQVLVALEERQNVNAVAVHYLDLCGVRSHQNAVSGAAELQRADMLSGYGNRLTH
jgi:hypothetical protein